MKKLLIIFTLLFLTVGCKTKRAVVGTTGTVTAEKQVQEIWQHHLASFPAFKTLVGSVQVSYNDGKIVSRYHCRFVWKKIRLYGCQLRWV